MKFYDRNKELELTTTLRLVYLLNCKPALTYTIRADDKSEGSYDNAGIQYIEYYKVSPIWRIFGIKCPLSGWRLDACLIICYK